MDGLALPPFDTKEDITLKDGVFKKGKKKLNQDDLFLELTKLKKDNKKLKKENDLLK